MDAFSGNTEWWVAGIGVNYEINDNYSLFGGVHEGVAVPSPRSILRSNVDLERSTSYELGLRHQTNNFNAELVGFASEFENIISTSAGLGGIATSNAGTGSVQGIETLASYDPFQDRAVRMPLFVSLTWTDTELDQPLNSGGGEDIYGDGDGGPGLAGANLPYIPEWKLAAGVGLETDTWGLDLTATYISDAFGTALNSPVPVTSSRQGLIDGGVLVDLSGYFQINDRTRLIGGVHNVFEEVMVTSRIPEGARSNSPREFYVGFEMLWEPRGFASAKSPITK